MDSKTIYRNSFLTRTAELVPVHERKVPLPIQPLLPILIYIKFLYYLYRFYAQIRCLLWLPITWEAGRPNMATTDNKNVHLHSRQKHHEFAEDW